MPGWLVNRAEDCFSIVVKKSDSNSRTGVAGVGVGGSGGGEGCERILGWTCS